MYLRQFLLKFNHPITQYNTRQINTKVRVTDHKSINVVSYCFNRKKLHGCHYNNQTWKPSYVQDPNFSRHFWSSNGKYVMSILHELRSLTGGGQNTTPSWVTIALLCIGLSVKSSTLHVCEQVDNIIHIHIFVYSAFGCKCMSVNSMFSVQCDVMGQTRWPNNLTCLNNWHCSSI